MIVEGSLGNALQCTSLKGGVYDGNQSKPSMRHIDLKRSQCQKNLLRASLSIGIDGCLFPFLSFSRSPSFIEGRCPGSKAAIFNQLNSFATAPIIYLKRRSFTISCWIKQMKWSPDELAPIYSDWYNPWQFFLSISTKYRRVIFQRHSRISDNEWFSLWTTPISLNTWIHVAVTCDHVKGILLIYADGKKGVQRTYFPEEAPFYGPTGRPYMIGNDGHEKNHQFYGSVMDLYVFGTALSLDKINKLRGEQICSFIYQ